ncbi:hypothetical protein OS493_021408 [Desmophyllum pertusum]|uniref:Uncharacterized protein n=1 Tax=Desmophyllum pertusum TaxID=174260 RepID=A0A9X0CQ65_9CNID|nr:hypothetical protein OS493_021408 [Desmophyllum pertusum]
MTSSTPDGKCMVTVVTQATSDEEGEKEDDWGRRLLSSSSNQSFTLIAYVWHVNKYVRLALNPTLHFLNPWEWHLPFFQCKNKVKEGKTEKKINYVKFGVDQKRFGY